MVMVKQGALLLALVTIFCETTTSKFHVNTDKNRIVDSAGRERLFHGTNVVQKTAPFVPITSHFDARYSFSEDDAKLMASMGYNTIRLGVLWAGLEPVMGEYNMTYLEQVVECVNIAERYGIHPVLDMHQDVFNRRFCGNGVPDWVPQPDEFNFPYPIEVEYEVDETGYPSRQDCDSVAWPNYHFTTSLSHSVGRLYKNYNGLMDKFAKFWGLVAQTFSDRDMIIGYELMNEPWCGDIFEDPTLLFPGIADRQFLEPMYDVLAAEIRKHDDETIILFEAITWEITGIGEALGFTHPPGGFEYSNRSILSFHNSVQDQVTSHSELYDFKWKEIQRLGIAGFVTETGDCCLDIADEVTKWGYSWHHWAYKLYGAWTWDSHGLFELGDDNNYDCPELASCLNEDRVRVYARTYPSAVAGTANYFHFDKETSEALLVFQPEPSIQEPTVIRVPVTWRYEAGVRVDVAPTGLASWSFMTASEEVSEEEAASSVEIRLEEAWNGEEISVVISRAGLN